MLGAGAVLSRAQVYRVAEKTCQFRELYGTAVLLSPQTPFFAFASWNGFLLP